MSSGFAFGANKPTDAPAFGQPTFGPQQAASSPFGISTSLPTTLPQFSSTFGGGAPTGGFQFSSPTAASSSTFATPTYNFNNPSAQPTLKPTTLNFGAPGSNTLTSQTQNLFGSPPVSTPNTSLLFGTPKGTNLSFNAPALTTANTSLSFVTSTSAAPASTGGLFGTATTTASSGFPFSLSSAAKPTAPTFGPSSTAGFNFSGSTFTSTAGTNLTFGATTPSTGITFGTAATVPSTGISFGAVPSTASAVPTFGPISTGITFSSGSGLPTANTGITFGSTPTVATTGLTFGAAPTVPSTGITFGAPSTTSTTGLTFGTPSATQSSGITFGTLPTASSAGLTFGGLPTAPKLSFGTTATVPLGNLNSTSLTTSAPTGLSFAAVKPTTSSVVPSLSLFGTTTLTGGTSTFTTSTSSGPTLSFNTSLPSTTTALNFSAPLTKPSITTTTTAAASIPAPIPVISTTTIAAAAAPTTTTSSGFSFGPTLTSSTAPSTGLGGIKLPTTITPSFNLLTQTSTAAAAAAGTATTTSAPQQHVGLGGVSATPPKHSLTSTTLTEQTETAPKDQPLPNELMQTVEHFKKFVQEQKSFSSEIARFSVRDLKKVEGDIDIVNSCINELESDLQKNKAIAEKLKNDTARGLQHVEMAQRTFDTPAGLQYDNTTPLNYFIELTDNFEKDMYILKVHIENIDKCVRNTGLPDTLTSQDLALGMRRLHETFVALAGRLQSVHNQVELQKEQYLTLRKQLLNDYTNVFEEKGKQIDTYDVLEKVPYQPPTLYIGPTPFNSLGNSQAQALAQNLPPSYPGTSVGAPSYSGFNIGGPSTVPLFGSNISGTSSLYHTSFQLQKPPVGNKRGKQ